MKILKGTFLYNHKVWLEVNGKEITRKVKYTTADGCYVVINNERVRKEAFEDERR